MRVGSGIFLLLIAACSPEQPVDEGPKDPVVVYAAFAEDPALTRRFDRYREATGIVIIHRYGEPAAIVDDLIRNDISPPADVLMTRSAVGAWLAAEEGALRPLYSEVVADRVPDWAQDSDRLWHATAADPAVIAYHGDEPFVHEWAELGHDRFSGKLCLSSSELAVNRAVIAVNIAISGTRPAELVARGWIKNLALPPFPSEETLAAAIADGRCGVGIVSRTIASQVDGIQYRQLSPEIATVSAIGIGRHARNEQGAELFVEWLIQDLAVIDSGDVTPHSPSIPAQYDEEARKLAERARYR